MTQRVNNINIIPPLIFEMFVSIFVVWLSCLGHARLVSAEEPPINQRPNRGGEPKILSMTELVYVDEQNPVKLTCTVTSDPRPVHLSFQCGERHYAIEDINKPDLKTAESSSYSISFENSVVRELMATSSATGDSLSCICNIFSRTGSESISNPTLIKKATLGTSFFYEPKSQMVKRGENAMLRCDPPVGDPQPRLRWERNGQQIKQKRDKYQFSEKESVLKVINFVEGDVGNYTCIAYNVLNKPQSSKPAKLSIAYHESWTEWDGWGPCDAGECGRSGYRLRYRQCWNQDLDREGNGCYGQRAESEKCEGSCKGGVIGGQNKGGKGGSVKDKTNNQGSNKGNGVTMNIDPSQKGGQIGGNSEEVELRRRRDQAVMVGVICSVVMFVIVALVVVLVLYRKSRSVALHKAYPSGRIGSAHLPSVYSPNSIVVSKHGETEIIATMPPCSQSLMSGGPYNTSPGQQMYFVDPNSSSVYKQQNPTTTAAPMYPAGAMNALNGSMSPGSAEVMVPMMPMKNHNGIMTSGVPQGYPIVNPNCVGSGDHYSSIANDVRGNENEYQLDEETATGQSECCKGNNNSSEPSGSTVSPNNKKYERLSNDSPCDSSSMAGATSENPNALGGGRCLIASKRFYESQNEILQSVNDEKFVMATFTSAGGRLCLPRSGVSLLIPEGAIAPGVSQEVYLAVSNEDRERPKLPDGGTILSPIIVCGPSNAHFLRPVILSFAHSALNPLSEWTLSVLHGTVLTRSAWQNLLSLGEETLNSAAFCQMDEDKCHIMVDSLHDKYCLVGKSKSGKSAVKRLLLAAFAPAALRTQEYNIRIYCVDDTQDALEHVIHVERKTSGGVMMDCCKLMHFRDSPSEQHGLRLALTELSMGWRCKVPNHQQNVPFNHIWCAIQSSLHASFSLEQPNSSGVGGRGGGATGGASGGSVNWLETKIEACQMASYDIHSFTIRLSTNDSTLLRRSMMDLTPTGVYDPPGLVFRLSPHLRHSICVTMDCPSYSTHEWVLFAKKLNFDRYINYFASKSSPTSHILDLWEARNRQDSAVRELICAIKAMAKHELAHLVESELASRVA
ncbi:netrin receptor UNC5C-like isoform X3 [Convolutriloba macropyga]|uniref:netrin receptor UNC5C-like isoform X3 n=1 Tax=Convolutriloba macropyga TaxID=536237 RepID=UPI003F521662